MGSERSYRGAGCGRRPAGFPGGTDNPVYPLCLGARLARERNALASEQSQPNTGL
jgi:hypothetical protein